MSTSSTKNSTDISSINWKTVLEYNLANAFAIPESAVVDDTFTKYKTSSTSSYKQSTALLSSLTEKLGVIKSNLVNMQTFAAQAQNATTDKKKETAYAQLRSLSAGIDSVTRSYKLENLTLLTGRSFELSYGGGTDMGVKLDNLSSSGTKGLGLATADKGAFTTISYDYLNKMRNASTDIAGLDITSVVTSEGDPTVQQLKDGEYQIEVEYMGDQSTIYIENLDGTVIDKQEKVDLTGTGQMNIKFGSGVTLSVEKTAFKTALGGDKYDYKTFGSVSLYANLTYESNVQHNLDDGTDNEIVTTSSVAVSRNGTLKGTTGTLKVKAEIAAVYEGRTGMTTGQYNVRVQYAGDNGAKSSLWLYYQNGNLVSTVRGINLSKGSTVSVDMGTGVAISLDPKNFTSDKRTYNTYIDYTAAEEPYKEFDYEAYAKKIDEALETVESNMDVVDQAQEELDSRYSIVQSALTIAITGGQSQSALSDVLSSALSAKSGSSSLSAKDLFSSINSSSSSSSINVLSDDDIFSVLTDNLTSLADADPAVLALYYR